ncbi:hypothetical protein B0H63DRAFT_535964, partial [Podospora didyma]
RDRQGNSSKHTYSNSNRSQASADYHSSVRKVAPPRHDEAARAISTSSKHLPSSSTDRGSSLPPPTAGQWSDNFAYPGTSSQAMQPPGWAPLGAGRGMSAEEQVREIKANFKCLLMRGNPNIRDNVKLAEAEHIIKLCVEKHEQDLVDTMFGHCCKLFGWTGATFEQSDDAWSEMERNRDDFKLEQLTSKFNAGVGCWFYAQIANGYYDKFKEHMQRVLVRQAEEAMYQAGFKHARFVDAFMSQ